VGKKLADQSRAEEAQPYLDRVVELDPDNAHGDKLRSLLIQADLQRKLLNFEKAIELSEKVIAEDNGGSSTDEALSNIAYYQNKLGDNEGAVRTYHRMLARNPESPGTLNAFAWFCATRGLDLENATDAAKKAVELTHEEPGYLDTLAECYYARGMYDEAIEAIDRAIAKDADAYFQKQRAKFVAASTGS
jgi:tetratricopeptide (TPR) repeat protein